MRRACGAIKGALAARRHLTRPAAARRDVSRQVVPGRHRTRHVPPGEWHNGRPRRTIGRLCCSIARTLAVRYASPAERKRNDSDAQPVCGNPRARREAAGSFHPSGRGASPRGANEGLLGRPEALTPDHLDDARNRYVAQRVSARETKTKTKRTQNGYQSGLKFCSDDRRRCCRQKHFSLAPMVSRYGYSK